MVLLFTLEILVKGEDLQFMIFEYHTWNQTFLNHMVQVFGICMNNKAQ